jgi:branched-chain amino acid transport system substrate-binding protein
VSHRLRPDVNPGGVKGVDDRGGTLTTERGAAVRDGKIEAVITVGAK